MAKGGGKQGEFISQLKSRPNNSAVEKKFGWSKSIATPERDKAQPKADLQKVSTQKEVQEDPSELPTDINGNIDVTQIKRDLISQIRSQRKGK